MINGAQLRPRLLVCLTFPFRPEAMPGLFEVLLALGEIRSAPLDVWVFTDCVNQQGRERLAALARHMSVEPIRVTIEIHAASENSAPPLAWAHKALLRSAFEGAGQEYTHFVYLDDLIRFSARNLFYFLKYRPLLRPYGLIPGFVQIEFSSQAETIILADLPAPTARQGQRVVDLEGIDFMCLDAPFVPIHVMDVELVREYLASPASDLQASRAMIGWGDAQRAAMGLTFTNPPQGHPWRVAVPVLRTEGFPHRDAWVHHVSNAASARHAAEPNFPLGRIRLDDMLAKG